MTFLPLLLLAAPTLSPNVSEVSLAGSHDSRQLLVTAYDPLGRPYDATAETTATVNPPGIASVREGLFLRPEGDGMATITLTHNAFATTVKVKVTGMTAPAPVSFRRDVVSSFNVGGCNAGACHGTPSGKNGFRLALRGSDPAADYLQLTREQFGRRSGSLDPNASLILLKALGRIPHEGGARFGASALPTEMVAAWLAGGKADDAANLPPLKSVAVSPSGRVQYAPHAGQQLAVVATFADGTVRDVTRLTVFSSSDPALADVGLTGRVEFKRPGEVAILCRYLEELVAVRLTYLEPREGFVWPNPAPANLIDAHVYTKLKQMTLLPSDRCTESEFVRRAYLDVCGRLPSVGETMAYLADANARKRDALIDELLGKPEFADFWSLKWADVLRSSRKTIREKGAVGFQHWLREQLRENVPFDRVAREILTANGNTFANPPANYYRIATDPQSLAESTAQLFLGVRMQCAKCHNHPFERWTQDDYYGTAAWFARVGQRPSGDAAVVFATRAGEVTQPRSGKPMTPRYPAAGDAAIAPGQDRRAAFADWLTTPGNPFFAKSVANRVWFHLLGRGIVDPVDDFRESNPASNDELLAALAADFARHKFDFKHLLRTILRSNTYQASANANDANKGDAKYFSHAMARPLTAEQLLDALGDVTNVPEKFAGLPAGTRAVQLPDGEVNHPFLKAFGQPARELACECERESDGNLGQALQLVNGPTVNDKIRSPKNRLAPLLAKPTTGAAIVTELYFAAVARAPTDAELTAALGHVAKAKEPRQGWEDVLWAILNTREFLYRN